MSSRARRRLQQDPIVIRVNPEREESEGDEDEPVLAPIRRNVPPKNPFALLGEGGDSGEGDEEDNDESTSGGVAHPVTSASKKKKKKKKTKRKYEPEQPPEEDVDAAIQEVNQILGQVEKCTSPSVAMTAIYRSLLAVDRRLLNANREMRKIFGSRVVRGEDRAKKSHKRAHYRTTALAAPRETWPKMDKPGLSMRMCESKDGCQYFSFEHSKEYQKVQYKFWEATETFDPNAIAAVLHAHPYHIDSLLQLSEVCKMSEDLQMATELIERALYCFECSFHTLFNVTQANCRLSYSVTENRPFFIALFRHLNYIGRRGCHRTALEFCKLLLSLNPDVDPLCVLLMIDYYSLRAAEYKFLIDLFTQWEASRNLSQLPNFAFSIPLAQFHTSSTSSDGGPSSDTAGSTHPDVESADRGLQDALIMFPSMLVPLLDKCGATLDPAVMKHSFFSSADLARDSKSLQLLLRLYIERSHSLWKEPEVLTWLEANSRRALVRVDAKDPMVEDCTAKRRRRYVGTPRNVYRHVMMSDFDQVAAALPRDMSESPILTYDPLPPPDSTSSYTRPPRSQRSGLDDSENPFLLFLRSMLPSFNTQQGGAGNRPHPLGVGALQLQEPRGAEGGVAGDPGRMLDLQATVNSLVRTLQDAIAYRPAEQDDDSSWSSDSGD